MQKLSMRKLSLLGLVLLAASAVTAAVMPKDKTDKTTPNYTLTATTSPNGCGDQLTCSSTEAVVVTACTASLAGTTTSTNGNNTSTLSALGGAQTAPTINGNTLNGANTSASPC